MLELAFFSSVKKLNRLYWVYGSLWQNEHFHINSSNPWMGAIIVYSFHCGRSFTSLLNLILTTLPAYINILLVLSMEDFFHLDVRYHSNLCKGQLWPLGYNHQTQAEWVTEKQEVKHWPSLGSLSGQAKPSASSNQWEILFQTTIKRVRLCQRNDTNLFQPHTPAHTYALTPMQT